MCVEIRVEIHFMVHLSRSAFQVHTCLILTVYEPTSKLQSLTLTSELQQAFANGRRNTAIDVHQQTRLMRACTPSNTHTPAHILQKKDLIHEVVKFHSVDAIHQTDQHQLFDSALIRNRPTPSIWAPTFIRYRSTPQCKPKYVCKPIGARWHLLATHGIPG